MKTKLFFFSGCLLLVSVLGLYAGGSGEKKDFYYIENGISKTTTAEFVGYQLKCTYLTGSGASTRTVTDACYRPWNGNWTSWETMASQATPNATIDGIRMVPSLIPEIAVSEYNGKRIFLELVIPADKTDYFWWEGNQLYYMQKQWEVK